MIARSAWLSSLLVILVAACSTNLPQTAAPIGPTAAPTAAIPTEPPTPEPTVDQNHLPPTTTTGWWGDPDNPTECLQPGFYRIGYRVAGIGDCAGTLLGEPNTITLDVGEDFDLHMTIPGEGELPIWPLPEAEDELVALGWLIFDDATMTYRGLSPGTTRLVTKGACFRGTPPAAPIPAAPGSCPVLVIQVRDIATDCVDLAADVCRAVGAAAVSNLFADPGQRIVGWVARPISSSIEWPGCGRVFAKVTLTLTDPDAEYDITIGRDEPTPSGLPRYAICTY